MYDPLTDGFRLGSRYDGRHDSNALSCFTAAVLGDWPAGEVRRGADLPDGFEFTKASGVVWGQPQDLNPWIEAVGRPLGTLVVGEPNAEWRRRYRQAPAPETCFSRPSPRSRWPYGYDEHLWRASKSPAWTAVRQWKRADAADRRLLQRARPELPALARGLPPVKRQGQLIRIRRVLDRLLREGEVPDWAPKYAIKAAMEPERTLAFLLVDPVLGLDGRLERFARLEEAEQLPRILATLPDQVRRGPGR